MNVGDKVKGVTYKYKHLSGYLLGNGMDEEYMYLRTKDDLISMHIDKLYKNFKVIKEADTTKPIKTYSMFG